MTLQFDWPVADPLRPDTRASADRYPAPWRNSNPFRNVYRLGKAGKWTIHTGDDLLITGNADQLAPIYAIADGEVTDYTDYPDDSSWGKVIVIKHGAVYARYAHVADPQVGRGEPVKRGQMIARCGNADGYYGVDYHLHFDISPTDVLREHPGDWPWMDYSRVDRDYVDPFKFIRDHRVVVPLPEGMRRVVEGVNFRWSPGGVVLGKLPAGEIVRLLQEKQQAAGYTWEAVITADNRVGWAADKYLAVS